MRSFHERCGTLVRGTPSGERLLVGMTSGFCVAEGVSPILVHTTSVTVRAKSNGNDRDFSQSVPISKLFPNRPEHCCSEAAQKAGHSHSSFPFFPILDDAILISPADSRAVQLKFMH